MTFCAQRAFLNVFIFMFRKGNFFNVNKFFIFNPNLFPSFIILEFLRKKKQMQARKKIKIKKNWHSKFLLLKINEWKPVDFIQKWMKKRLRKRNKKNIKNPFWNVCPGLKILLFFYQENEKRWSYQIEDHRLVAFYLVTKQDEKKKLTLDAKHNKTLRAVIKENSWQVFDKHLAWGSIERKSGKIKFPLKKTKHFWMTKKNHSNLCFC